MTDGIDASIDRLDTALTLTGFEPLAAPAGTVPLDAIAEAVHPYRVPAELILFWERVDPAAIAVTTFPELIGPSFALELHRAGRALEASPPAGPPLLFPLAYSSHVFWSIELASEWGDGGTVFRWAWDEDAFQIAYRSLADLVDTVAELVAENRLERHGRRAFVPIEAEEERRDVRSEAAGPHPVYGAARRISREVEAWPAHWLASSGIDLRDREPVGATHTIAALVAEAEKGPVRGRIAGTVTRLVGIGGDVLAVVDDGTGAIDVACPAGTSPWGPAQSGRFEFDVTLEAPAAFPPDFDSGQAEVQRHVLSGRLGEAQSAAGELLARVERHRPSALATAIRPLD